jgi:hypothetical protein
LSKPFLSQIEQMPSADVLIDSLASPKRIPQREQQAFAPISLRSRSIRLKCRLCDDRKMIGKNLLALLSNLPMLKLRVIVRSQLYVVNPRPKCTVHV